MSTPASQIRDELAPPSKFRKLSGPPPLMDRSGIVTSCFIRSPENRGKMPMELIGRHYKDDLTAFLHRAIDIGTQWPNPAPKWPETQKGEMLEVYKNDIYFVPTEEEMERIEFYINEEIKSKDVDQMPSHIWEQTLERTNPKFTSDKRLQSLLVWLRKRAESDWDRGSREALLKEALMESWQQERLGVRKLPPSFPHLVITGPAPWRKNFLASQNFCAHSLMAASSVVLSMHHIWDRMLENLEFLPVDEISTNRPFYLYDLEEKLTTALDTARKTILQYIFRCAEHMWVHQKKWEGLVTREHGVSADMVRLLNCLTSLMCRRLREKTLASVDAWSQLILTFRQAAGPEVEVAKPLIKFKLDMNSEQLGQEMIRARQFVASAVLRVYEVTDSLPSVGTIMFNPNHKYKNPRV